MTEKTVENIIEDEHEVLGSTLKFLFLKKIYIENEMCGGVEVNTFANQSKKSVVATE